VKKQFQTKTVLALVLAASALASIVTAMCFYGYLGGGTPLFTEIKTYIALRRKIGSEYVGKVDGAKVSQAALAAAVDALEDKWSLYLTPEQLEAYLESSSNAYAGIGISVVADEGTGGLAIQYVYPGSGAERAGVEVGDVVIAVDGEDITHLEFDEAVGKVRREIGESVLLRLIGAGGAQRDVEVEYAVILVSPVHFEMLEGGVGYIAIYNFEAHSADDFIAAVDALVVEGAKAFLFDVRNNGGGRAAELVRMLDYLLPEGEIFVGVTARGQEEIIYSDEHAVTRPAAVLVNEHSYSAAEYFAAVLREYNYAEVVGTQTTGKNRSQVTYLLPDGGALHISTGEYLTPSRVSLTETGGLTPDVVEEMSEEDIEALYYGKLPFEEDVQLMAALAHLNQAS
jgi:carboxyl-terminal processing protease